MDEEKLVLYDRLINLPSNDWEIYYWAVGQKETPEDFDNIVMDMLKQHAKNEHRESRITMPDLNWRVELLLVFIVTVRKYELFYWIFINPFIILADCHYVVFKSNQKFNWKILRVPCIKIVDHVKLETFSQFSQVQISYTWSPGCAEDIVKIQCWNMESSQSLWRPGPRYSHQ